MLQGSRAASVSKKPCCFRNTEKSITLSVKSLRSRLHAPVILADSAIAGRAGGDDIIHLLLGKGLDVVFGKLLHQFTVAGRQRRNAAAFLGLGEKDRTAHLCQNIDHDFPHLRVKVGKRAAGKKSRRAACPVFLS